MNEQLGYLEETILLLVLIMHDQEVYAVSIANEYEKQKGRSISIPAVHTVLKRLQKKGMVKSFTGKATPTRGGKRKKLYDITKYGYKILKGVQEERSGLWQLAPKLI